jgi:hypothetical protein
VGELTQLQVLYLRENLLSGSLPAGLLTNLTEMRYLMLQRNAFTGGVPSEIGRLVKLSDLAMYENRVST